MRRLKSKEQKGRECSFVLTSKILTFSGKIGNVNQAKTKKPRILRIIPQIPWLLTAVDCYCTKQNL